MKTNMKRNQTKRSTLDVLARAARREQVNQIRTTSNPVVTVCKDFKPSGVRRPKGVKNKHFVHDNKSRSLSRLSSELDLIERANVKK